MLAVDAGNTKTEALWLGTDGAVLGYGRAGVGDIYRGEAEAIAGVESAISGATGGPCSALPATHVALRLAGVDWPEDVAFWQRVLQQRWGYAGSRSINNDGFASIRLGALDGCGVALTAGTGAAMAARHRCGSEFGLNMWMFEGLGALGLVGDALIAVSRQVLGIGPPTVLGSRLAEHFQLPDAETVLHQAHSRHGDIIENRRTDAAICVTRAAADGDEVAVRIVTEQADRFCSYATGVIGRAGYRAEQSMTIVLNGSVLRDQRALFNGAVRQRLRTQYPAATIITARHPPVVGAALDAIGESGVEVDQMIMDRLVAALVDRGLPVAADQDR